MKTQSKVTTGCRKTGQIKYQLKLKYQGELVAQKGCHYVIDWIKYIIP